jgi:putative lysine transport system substrate-binding protein
MRNRLFVSVALGALAAGLCACSSSSENTLVVGMECAYAPFDWETTTVNDHTVQLYDSTLYADGYDVDISNAIATYLGRKLVIKQIAWESLIVSLQTNDIDCIISDMSYTADRDLSVDFSDAYYQSVIVGVVKKTSQYASATSIADLAGCKAISQLGTVEDDVIDQIENVTHVTAASTFGSATLSVQAGDADVLLAEDPVAQCIVNVNTDLQVITFSDGFTGVDSNALSANVPVREGDSDLQSDINAALATISQTTREEWMQEASERCSVTTDETTSS